MQNIAKIDFAPGIQKDRSPLASEPGWIDGQWIRFRGEKPESMGGYTSFTGSPDVGAAAYAAHTWNTLDGTKYLAVAEANTINLINASGTITDVTPPYSYGFIPSTVTYSYTDNVTTYTVNWSNHGFIVGCVISVLAAGSTTTYTVATVIDENTFTYEGADPNATGLNQAFPRRTYWYSVVMPSGDAWFLGNFGEDLVSLIRGGPLYIAKPSLLSSTEFTADGGSYTGAGTPWAAGTGRLVFGWTPSSTESFAFEASTTYKLTIRIAKYASPGSVYLSYWDGTNYLSIEDGTTTHAATAGKELNQYLAQSPGLGAEDYEVLTFYITTPATIPGTFQLSLYLSATNGILNYIKIVKSSSYVVPNAPKKSLAMFVDPNRFVVLLGTVQYGLAEVSLPGRSTAVDAIFNPLLVRWCDQEDITDWTTAPDNLAGELPISQGAKFIAGVATRGQNVLWTESGLIAMQYTGDPATVFSFQPLAQNCGLISYRAFSPDNSGAVYWMSNAGQFYRFAGGAVEPIPCTVLRDVYENTSSSYLDKIHVGHNPGFQEVFFFYPDSRDSATTATRYAKICYGTGVWDAGTFACSAWLPQGVFSYPIAVDNDGDVLYMENGNDANGSSLTTSITSSFFDIEDGGNLAWIERIIPDFDDQQGDVDFDFNLKMYPNATATTKGPYTATTTTRKLDMIFTARQLQVVISSAADPSFWRLGALRFDIRKSGSKR